MTATPQIRTVGLSGLLVSFADALTEPANRAAIAFRAAVAAEDWPEVGEVSCSLVSTFVEADLATVDVEDLSALLRALLGERDWLAAPLPGGRSLWRIPTVYGTDLAPQLEDAAAQAGCDAETAIAELSSARVRVLTLGFAPGQPYLGTLPERWDIPRQQDLTRQVPAGALILAIRQLIVFTAAAPTGWRHVGQTAFRNFRPDSDRPIVLSPGDELTFPAVDRDRLIALRDTADGGATREDLS